MPKIFLIKDRLQQQQLRLLEQQKNQNDGSSSLLSPLSDSQPLSLIVNKRPPGNFCFINQLNLSWVTSKGLEKL